MFFLPYHRFTLSTPLTPAQVIAGMNEQAGPTISTDIMGKGRGDFDPFAEEEEMIHPYNGMVYEDYFAISRSVGGFPMPVIWGTVFEQEQQTYVYVVIQPEMSEQFIVLFIFLGIFLLVCLGAIISMLMNGFDPKMLAATGTFIIPYSLLLMLFYNEQNIARSFLTEVLKGKIV